MSFEEKVEEFLNSQQNIAIQVLSIENFNEKGFTVVGKNKNLFSELYSRTVTYHISWKTFIKSLEEVEIIEYI